jgi:Ala-tRNA(Pro) deacylase
MPIPRSIKQYLFHHNVSYSHKIHSVAFTSQEIAALEHVPGGEFAKTVVLEADGRLILAVVPGDHIVNIEALRDQVGWGDLSLATEKQFISDFPGCQPGAMPPFGRLFGMPVYCDNALARHPEIEFNGGTHVDTVRMKFADFAKLENPMLLSFSEKRTGRRVWAA